MIGLLALVAGLAQTPELVTPLGRNVHALLDTAGVIAQAESALARAPDNVDSLIRLGQAYASLWRYHDAVGTYDRAIALAPHLAVLYRYRGHRYISLRRFPDAIRDLELGAALDSTSWDIWYHLGVAYYLSSRYADAAEAYRRCLALRSDVESQVAAADWMWMSLARSGRVNDAAAIVRGIPDTLGARENIAYYVRLLFYAGRRTEADLRAMMETGDLEYATVGYGLANWLLVKGDVGGARRLFRRIVDTPYWPAFGFIAAETELARERQ